METSVNKTGFILNWSLLNKCLLMLGMGMLIHISWLVWKLYIYWQPALWDFVRIDMLKYSISLDFFALFAYSLAMLLCWQLHWSKNAQLFLPYLCILTYALSMVPGSYMVGIMSPASIVTMVVSIIVGLILFRRMLVYSAVTVVLLILAALMHETLAGRLRYAPLFTDSISDHPGQASAFWSFTMLWFITPILLGGFFLLDVLLSQWRRRERGIRLLSQLDPLTGLYNRRALYHFLHMLINKPNDNQRVHAMILLDLDFFKKINDVYGHITGDRVLVATAELLKSHVRKQDVVARIGGEEFVIVLTSTTYEQTQQITERCRHAIMDIQVYSDQGKRVTTTASFGVMHFNAQAKDMNEILRYADLALYQAKTSGRNQAIYSQHDLV